MSAVEIRPVVGQRGGALVAALCILSAMTLLATMSLLAGGADLAVSTRQVRQKSAFYAAESALETTLTELSGDGGPLPAATWFEPWPSPDVGVRSWQDGPWACSRRVCLIPDRHDADADPATTVVLFNRAFGHGASPLRNGGYPVVQLLVTVKGGGASQAVVAEVAPVTCSPRVEAAWTAAGELSLSGDILVSGGGGLAALAEGGPVRLLGGAAVNGERVSDPEPLPADVLELLNAGGTLTGLEELPEPPADGELRGQFWSRGDCARALEGAGLLIVHNPKFDPARHEASRLAIEEGVLVEGRDPGYSHLDPARQPARLSAGGGGTYSGLIVADAIEGPAAPFTLRGALVTLSRSPLSVSASAALRITGSREAIERAGRGELRVLTAFRSLSASPGQPGPCPCP